MAEQLLKANGNAKLKKRNGDTETMLVAGLTLAPDDYAGLGKTVCPWAGSCRKACVLWFAGRTVTKTVRAAAIRRTRWFFDDRPAFVRQLQDDIDRLRRKAKREDTKLVVRLNVASDIAWERVAPELFMANPDVLFYDYTKSFKRADEALTDPRWPSNYELTYSWSENSDTQAVADLLKRGGNVSLVTDTRYVPSRHIADDLPGTVSADGSWFDTVDGDVHDIRLRKVDGEGVVVCLRGKGGKARVAEAVADGFAVHHAPETSMVTLPEQVKYTRLTIGVS